MGTDGSESLLGGVEQVEIRIADYDPSWPAKYEEHAARIRAALGAGVQSLEHVGSTSVPLLPAKAIIDVLLVVADAADEASYMPALSGAGYELRVREPGFDEHRMLRTTARDVHLHVFPHGSLEVVRMLRFRDALRASAQERELYAQTKRALAAREWPSMDAYAAAKGEVVEAIIARAGGPTH